MAVATNLFNAICLTMDPVVTCGTAMEEGGEVGGVGVDGTAGAEETGDDGDPKT